MQSTKLLVATMEAETDDLVIKGGWKILYQCRTHP
jgi:hypothetical protein